MATETRSATGIIEEILKKPMHDIKREILELRSDNPKAYDEGRKIARDVLESHDSLLYSLMVGTPIVRGEQERRVQYACMQHALGKVSLAGMI